MAEEVPNENTVAEYCISDVLNLIICRLYRRVYKSVLYDLLNRDVTCEVSNLKRGICFEHVTRKKTCLPAQLFLVQN